MKKILVFLMCSLPVSFALGGPNEKRDNKNQQQSQSQNKNNKGGGQNQHPKPDPAPAPKPSPPQGKADYSGHNSGLPWMTGLANTNRNDECPVNEQYNSQFLKRKSDVFAGFFTHDNVGNMLNHLKAKRDNWACFTKQGVIIAQVLPILAQDDSNNAREVLSQGSALNKKYIDFWTQFAQLLKETGQDQPFLRLGHEMNLNGGYPWATPKNVSSQQFVGLFKLVVDTVRPIVPKAEFVWNPGKYSAQVKAEDLWPGDDYVDVVGVDWYDNGGGGVPVLQTQADWDKHFNDSGPNGPRGVGAWYQFAKKHNKPISFPEWAMKANKGDDNRTVFVENMFKFFQMASKEGFMSYESWYNEPGQHQLYPHSLFPRAGQLYQKLWSK
jgi:hypothetical protein